MKSNLRRRAEVAKKLRCKNLIAVLENPKNLTNIGSVIRNVDALGVEKLYVVDGYNILPDDWQKMRENKSLNTVSVSAVKWSYVKLFKTTKECFSHLKKKGFISYVTSPHQKGKINKNVEDADFTKKGIAVWFGRISRFMSHWTYGSILGRLERKCEDAGVQLLYVDSAYTSQKCSSCGKIDKTNRKGELYSCPCGNTMDADYNASRNLAELSRSNLYVGAGMGCL